MTHRIRTQLSNYDVFGSLVSVAEDVAGGGTGDCDSATGLLTIYSYYEADRLIHVCGRSKESTTPGPTTDSTAAPASW